MLARFNTIPERNRRKDRQNCYIVERQHSCADTRLITKFPVSGSIERDYCMGAYKP